MSLVSEEKAPDPDYDKDRARFCLDQELVDKYRREREQLEGIARLSKDLQEREARKDDYAAVAELKKLTIHELETLLSPLLNTKGYAKLQFGAPEMGKDVFVPFAAQDTKSGRIDRESSHELQKVIKTALQDTNWRLMSEGISYRLGFLSGRLRAYEREEDLLKLVEKHIG